MERVAAAAGTQDEVEIAEKAVVVRAIEKDNMERVAERVNVERAAAAAGTQDEVKIAEKANVERAAAEVNRVLVMPLPGKTSATASPLTDVTTLGSSAARLSPQQATSASWHLGTPAPSQLRSSPEIPPNFYKVRQSSTKFSSKFRPTGDPPTVSCPAGSAGSRYCVLGTRYCVLGTKYCVLGTRYCVLGTRYCVLGIINCELGTRYCVLGTRYCVLGTR